MATVLSNEQIVTAIGLPSSIVTDLQTAQGDEFKAVANQFLTALVNKIVYQKVETMKFDNPFKKFDGYPINYGDTIENIYVDKAMGDKFNKDATDPFEKTAPTVKSMYATINYEMQYPITIEDKILKRAALNQSGFMNLTNAILKSLITGRSVDEYLATIIMLNNEDIYAKGFETVSVSALGETAKAKAITKKIASVVRDFALPSIDNNKLGVMNVTSPDHCLLIIKDSLAEDINFDYLSGVYNLSKVELGAKIIRVRSFKAVVNTLSGQSLTPNEKGDDIDFVILDDRGFDNHVALEDGGTIYNPRGKYTNYFSNLWKVISYRYDFQARAFKLS